MATLPTPPRHSYTQAQLNQPRGFHFPQTFPSSPVSPVVPLRRIFPFQSSISRPTILPAALTTPTFLTGSLLPSSTQYSPVLLPYYSVERYSIPLLLCGTLPCSPTTSWILPHFPTTLPDCVSSNGPQPGEENYSGPSLDRFPPSPAWQYQYQCQCERRALQPQT